MFSQYKYFMQKYVDISDNDWNKCLTKINDKKIGLRIA